MRSSGGPARSAFLYGTFVFLLAASGIRGELLLLQAPPSIPAGNYPHYVEPGDFNGDGIQDLAVSERFEGTVSIYLGNDPDRRGDSFFTKLGSFATSSIPYNLTLFDLNIDGIVDLIVGLRQRNGVDLLLGGGTGGVWDSTFSDPTFLYSGKGAYHAAVGDWNGDEIFDLAVANDCFGTNEGDSVSILIGTGENGVWDGGFLDPIGYVVDHTPQMVIATDVDDDGILDLLTANVHGSSVSVLIGDGEAGVGDGTFLPRVDYPVGSGPHTLVCADFNEDGIEDLATCNWNHDNVSVLIGNGSDGVGDGTFSSFGNYPTGDAPRRIVSADLNGDGILDLATSEYYGRTVSVLLGRGTNGCGNGRFDPATSFGGGGMSWSLAAGDFDGDGNADLITANPHQDALLIYPGEGDGLLPALAHEEIRKGASAILAEDFNDDQIPDLAVACREESVVVVLLGGGTGGVGDGTFQPAGAFPAGDEPLDMAAGDFNSDGIADLACADAGSPNIRILAGGGSGGSGNGTFEAPVSYQTSIEPSSITMGDFNSDGIIDLVVSETDLDRVEMLLGNGTAGQGDGTFGSPTSWFAGDGPPDLAVSDYNGDQIEDIAAASAFSDSVYLLLGIGTDEIGNGTFEAPVAYAVGAKSRSVISADFDSDGIEDLALSCPQAGNISILIGNGAGGIGDGTFESGVFYPAGRSPGRLVTADLDGDGVLDLVAADSAGGGAVVLRGIGSDGVGDGTFAEPVFYGIESGTVALAAGHFDGESGLDLAFTGPAFLPEIADHVKIVRNDSPGIHTFLPVTNSTPPPPLLRNRPNPFNPTTTVVYRLSRESLVRASVYDASGRLVRRLDHSHHAKGRHELTWDGTGPAGNRAPSGCYLIRMETADWTHTIKAILVH